MIDQPSTDAAPFANLTPDRVLDAVQDLGFDVDGRLLQLNSYENRVFQLGLDDGTFVIAKFYRPGRWTNEQILEEHVFARELQKAEVPVVVPLTLQPREVAAAMGQPATLGLQGGMRIAISPRKGGRGPELEDTHTLTWIGRFLARIHQVGSQRPFQHRHTISVANTGGAARDWLLSSDMLPPDHMPAWSAASQHALKLAQACFDHTGPVQYKRLHGDCHIGNILWTPEGPHFVDLDDACMGPAIQDFWMLLSGDPAQRQNQLYALLDGYESMLEFDWREIKLIEALRTLRMIHHSAWIARRWSDPAFPAAFSWFNQGAYWQQQTDQLRQQIELMHDQLESPSM